MKAVVFAENAPLRQRERAWSVVVLLVGGIAILLALVARPAARDVPLLAAVAAAGVVTTALGLRLPRGDVVRVDALAASAALALIAAPSGMLAILVGSFTGMMLARRETRSSVISVAVDSCRHMIALGVAYLVQASVAGWFSLSGLGMAMVATIAYVAIEFASLVVQHAFTSGSGYRLVANSMLRSVWQIYLGQACLGVALVVVYPSMGLWAIPVMTVLGAILLNGFALYLRVKIAYQETIGALAKVSELHLSGRQGHVQEVANMAVAVGRELGLGVRNLEALNYAGLLHEVGLLGQDVGGPIAQVDVVSWTTKGAEILGAVPFLAGAAEMVRCQTAGDECAGAVSSVEARIGGAILRACCLLEDECRLRADADSRPTPSELAQLLRERDAWLPAGVVTAAVRVANPECSEQV